MYAFEISNQMLDDSAFGMEGTSCVGQK